MNNLPIDYIEIHDFSFSEDLRETYLNAVYWNHRELEALCLGVPPKKYADIECCGTPAERESVRARIKAGYETGSLYATFEPTAEFERRVRIDPTHAVNWVISQTPSFPKFPEWLVSELRPRYEAQVAERHAKGRYTLDEVSRLIAEQEGWNDAGRKEVLGNLIKAADDGQLRVRTPETGNVTHPQTVRHFHEVVLSDDVNDWAVQSGNHWHWSVKSKMLSEPEESESASGGGDESWESKSRIRANEIIKRDGLKDLYPSQVNIADEIAKEFRGDGVMGADGKPLSGAYIKRHALTGISSARGKQLSTSMRRGK